MNRPNDIQVSEHFHLYEFEDKAHDHIVVLNPLLLTPLEHLRSELCAHYQSDIPIIITSGTRTPRTNKRLASILGWTTHGGSVAPDSKHLPHWGGIAADLYAIETRHHTILPIKLLAEIAKPFFNTVLSHYPTHIHVHMKYSAKLKAKPNE